MANKVDIFVICIQQLLQNMIICLLKNKNKKCLSSVVDFLIKNG